MDINVATLIHMMDIYYPCMEFWTHGLSHNAFEDKLRGSGRSKGESVSRKLSRIILPNGVVFRDNIAGGRVEETSRPLGEQRRSGSSGQSLAYLKG